MAAATLKEVLASLATSGLPTSAVKSLAYHAVMTSTHPEGLVPHDVSTMQRSCRCWGSRKPYLNSVGDHRLTGAGRQDLGRCLRSSAPTRAAVSHPDLSLSKEIAGLRIDGAGPEGEQAADPLRANDPFGGACAAQAAEGAFRVLPKLCVAACCGRASVRKRRW